MNRGKLAKARRIAGYLDRAIALCESDEVFELHEYRETQALIDALLRARMCVANVAMRAGDDSLYLSQPIVRLRMEYPTDQESKLKGE